MTTVIAGAVQEPLLPKAQQQGIDHDLAVIADVDEAPQAQPGGESHPSTSVWCLRLSLGVGVGRSCRAAGLRARHG
ncbi:hypothetical protein OH809_40115 [Streptomyces sp. NBC_00873]|uniref:hypothetical protein n=1 Tax=unclassified Streptomyces TaxID=2593676 RepID=UPI003863D39C|nr:hypothetical protein OH809_40115 [Streptomyces sp. NBC_00873]WTA41850.1 hypothetical protein OH821_03585 [Streptomyces sp. NBC_00842]